MDNFNYKKYLSEGRLYEEEEDQFENDLAIAGDKLADEIEDELESKDVEINEVATVVGILGYILLSNTVANMISGLSKKLFKKYNFGKGEAAAKKIYDFTHKLEGDFKKPIERVVGLFTKDPKTKKIITDSLFALLILSLGVKAGSDAVNVLAKGNVASGTVSGLKAALKGKDLSALIKDIAGAVA